MPAGDFSSWLAEIVEAIRGERTSDVPCDGCTACCTSSQFVHIDPSDADTLSHVSPKLRFPAPFMPRGHFVLGYDERGHCPMMVDSHCTIYEHRPRTCRTYDCRVFRAAGIEADEDKVLIARQARRWQFSFPTEADRILHAAVKAAAAFIREHPDELPAGTAPNNATRLAVLAIQLHHLFLQRDETPTRATVVTPSAEVIRTEMMRLAGARSTEKTDGGEARISRRPPLHRRR
ncbi:MAG TPA: YkgJ family cysteine cluster protein [Chloroflexota bacterium]|nr:YkgJ family cysteine cluster protein [Chloroflexota bacterium]